jgi:Xaa-Pro aminopeptidase
MAMEEQRDDMALVTDAHDRSLDARQAGLSTTAPLSSAAIAEIEQEA